MKTAVAAPPFVNARRMFCESFAWKIDVVWHDAMGIYKSSVCGLIVAKIELARGLHAFDVKVMHRLNGEIDSHSFAFKDYLSPEGAMDVRSGGKGAPDHPMPETSFHAWDGKGGCEWYLIEPADTRPLCVAVESYVRSFEGR